MCIYDRNIYIICVTLADANAHKDMTKNFWEERMNDKVDQQRQELPGFPKLGEHVPVPSCVIIPSKSEKQESGRGRGHRYQDDNVFEEHPQERGYHHNNQWERGDRERRRSDERRGPGRQNFRAGSRSEIDKSQNWRRESNDVGNPSSRGDRDDRFESDRFNNRGDRFGRSDGFRNDRSDRKFDRFETRDRKGDRSDRRFERNDRFDDRYDRNEGFDRDRRGRSNREERRDFQDRDRDWVDRNSSGGRKQSRRGDGRQGDRSRGEMGPYREDERNRKSSEGRWTTQSGSGSSNNFSYASAVSNRGESESKEGAFDAQEGDREIRSSQSLPSGEYQGKGSDSRQEDWRRQDRTEAPMAPGHMKYNTQRKPVSRSSFSEQESKGRPSSRSNDQSAQNASTEWTDESAPRNPDTEGREETDPTESGFIEIRNRNKSRGRGVFSEGVDGPRPTMGRGRGRPYHDPYVQEGAPGPRWNNGKNSSGTDSRFTRGGSPQKSQGMGRARMPDKQSQVSYSTSS